MRLRAAVNEWVWLHMRVGAEQAARVTLPQSSSLWPLAEKRSVTVELVPGLPPPGLVYKYHLGAEVFWLNSLDFILCFSICLAASKAKEEMCTNTFLLTQVALWGPGLYLPEAAWESPWGSPASQAMSKSQQVLGSDIGLATWDQTR